MSIRRCMASSLMFIAAFAGSSMANCASNKINLTVVDQSNSPDIHAVRFCQPSDKKQSACITAKHKNKTTWDKTVYLTGDQSIVDIVISTHKGQSIVTISNMGVTGWHRFDIEKDKKYSISSLKSFLNRDNILQVTIGVTFNSTPH